MFYSEEIIEEVRQRNDIVDVISSYVRLQKRGSAHMGLCPFHNEKTPSFSVSQNKQMFYCFGCGVGGNVYTFLMQYQNLTFLEALKDLADRAGVALPEREMTGEDKKRMDRKNRLLEINKTAAKYYYYQLRHLPGAPGYQYLKNRKLTDETISHFGLGFANKYSDDLYQYLKKAGYEDAFLKDSGLIAFDEKHGGHDKFWNRVMFPIMDANNRVIGFGGRVMGEGKPKYLNSPETAIFDKSRNLYGLNFARLSHKKYSILCEGYMDVIALHQGGFTNAVASLGTAFTGLHANLLKRYAKEVYLCFDSDNAGVNAALRAIPIFREAGIATRVIHMEPYKDPDEFLQHLGPEAFEERIAKAENSFYFEVAVLEREYKLADPEEKTRFFHAVAKKLVVFHDEIERNNYIEAMDRKYHMGFDNLRKLVNQYGAQKTEQEVYDALKKEDQAVRKRGSAKEEGILEAQKLLLTWLIEDVSLFEKISGILGPKDFKEGIFKQVACQVFEQFEKEGKVTPARILSGFDDKEEQTQAAALFHTYGRQEMNRLEREKALNEIVVRIKRYSLEEASRSATDIEKLQEIIKEQNNLQKLHISL